MEVLNHILALQSHKIMVHGRRIKGVIHINVMLQNINTAYKYLEIMQDKIMLDYKLLNEYVVLPPQTLRPDSLQNESDLIIAEITNIHNTRDIATVSLTVPFTRPKYPILTQFGIPTDYSRPEIARTSNSILKELERLGKEHSLEVQRENNTKASVFFIPKKLSSKKSFNNWASKSIGVNSMFNYISNGKLSETANELTSVGYVCEYISTHYHHTFTEVGNHNSLNIVKRMNTVETAAVFSGVGVTDKK